MMHPPQLPEVATAEVTEAATPALLVAVEVVVSTTGLALLAPIGNHPPLVTLALAKLSVTAPGKTASMS